MKHNNIHHLGSDHQSVHHAPLIVDINAQRSYRKWGHVSWPPTIIEAIEETLEQQTLHSILGQDGYTSWPSE